MRRSGLLFLTHGTYVAKRYYCAGWSGCRVADEGAGKSGDGCVANITGKDDEGIIERGKTIMYRLIVYMVSPFLFLCGVL